MTASGRRERVAGAIKSLTRSQAKLAVGPERLSSRGLITAVSQKKVEPTLLLNVVAVDLRESTRRNRTSGDIKRLAVIQDLPQS